MSNKAITKSIEGFFTDSPVPLMVYQALLQFAEGSVGLLDRDYRLVWAAEGRIAPEEYRPVIGQVCYEQLYDRSEPCVPCPATSLFEENKLITIATVGSSPAASKRQYIISTCPILDKDYRVSHALIVSRNAGISTEMCDRIKAPQTASCCGSELDLPLLACGTNGMSSFRLAKREHQVLTMMADGLTNPEIARVLLISPCTVKTYVARIFDKLGADDRTRAVALAIRLKLI